MAAEESSTTESASTDHSASSPKRQRSTIQFPYGDLDDALEVVLAIHTNGGVAGTPEQVAFWMGSTVTSGAFRTKLAAARLFGMVQSDGTSIALTPLGRQIVDPKTAREARAVAFGRVPLFRLLFNEYRTGVLPPDNALESAIQGLGVPSKQKSRARQTFQRSAEQAGVLSPNKDRLVLPAGLTSFDAVISEQPIDTAGGLQQEPARVGVRHPLIEGLIQTLPPEGHPWGKERQDAWLQLAANVFSLLYPSDRPRESSDSR